MSNPSIIHRPFGVIHRFGTLPSKRNMSIQGMDPALISTHHPSDYLPYSSDNRQVKDQNRPIIDRRDSIIDRPTTTFRLLAAIAAQVTAQVTGEVTAPVTASVRRILELRSGRGELGNVEIFSAFELKSRRRMSETYLEAALRESLIEYTIPDKPTSSFKKYRLTDKGGLGLQRGNSDMKIINLVG